MVKPGIKEEAVLKTMDLDKSSNSKLNMLFLFQIYFFKQAKKGDDNAKDKLKLTNMDINEWFNEEAKSVLLQINMQEINEFEEVNLHHHELHKKKVTKLVILELETERGVLFGHKECSDYINADVASLLENIFVFNDKSRKYY